LSKRLGQQFIVENRPGAGNNLGTDAVAKAAPDGYTIVLVNPANAINASLYKHLNFVFLRDIDPVAGFIRVPNVMEVHPSVPAKTVAEFIAYVKANPDKVFAGTGGAGSPQHIGGVLLQNATGARFQFVPYRGGAPAMQDLVAGQIDFMVDDPTNALPQLRSGTIKAYAVAAKSRLVQAPDIPTVDEAGLPDFYYSRWHALWAPKGTPKDVITKLNAAIVDALANPGVRARLTELAQEIYPRDRQTPEALGAFQKAEIEKWWPIIKAAGIKAE